MILIKIYLLTTIGLPPGGSSTVQYSTVQYSTVEHNTVSTVQYSTVQYSTVQYSTAQYSTAQHSTAQHSTVQYSTVQYSIVQYSTVQYSTVHIYTNSTQNDTMKHNNTMDGAVQHKKATVLRRTVWQRTSYSTPPDSVATHKLQYSAGQCGNAQRLIGMAGFGYKLL